VVRDNGANMVLGISLVGWPDIPCFGHTLQFCVGAGLSLAMVSRLTGAAKKLIGHFKHSSLAMSSLKEKQKTLSITEHTLISEFCNSLELRVFHVGATTATALGHLWGAA